MKRKFRIGAIISLAVVVLTLVAAGAVFAGNSDNGTCAGECSEGAGPGLGNGWGQGNGTGTCTGDGTCDGTGVCTAEDGTGLQNRWGQGNGTATGKSYGECSDGTGPDLQNCWGRKAQ